MRTRSAFRIPTPVVIVLAIAGLLVGAGHARAADSGMRPTELSWKCEQCPTCPVMNCSCDGGFGSPDCQAMLGKGLCRGQLCCGRGTLTCQCTDAGGPGPCDDRVRGCDCTDIKSSEPESPLVRKPVGVIPGAEAMDPGDPRPPTPTFQRPIGADAILERRPPPGPGGATRAADPETGGPGFACDCFVQCIHHKDMLVRQQCINECNRLCKTSVIDRPDQQIIERGPTAPAPAARPVRPPADPKASAIPAPSGLDSNPGTRVRTTPVPIDADSGDALRR